MRIESIPVGVKVKVYFKEKDSRIPMIGKFVETRDADVMRKKGFVRFVNQTRLDYWNDEEPQLALTKLYVAEDFLSVKPIDG